MKNILLIIGLLLFCFGCAHMAKRRIECQKFCSFNGEKVLSFEESEKVCFCTDYSYIDFNDDIPEFLKK